MKKTFIIISILMALGTNSYASTVSQQWIKTYGGSEDDVIQSVQQTMDGGYIAIGNTRTSQNATIDVLILKIDVNGNVSWQKTYRYGTWINDAYAIQQTADGGYIVAGFTSSFSFVKGWILKLDSNGEILWQKAYSGVSQFTSIQQTADGGYIVVGDYSPDYLEEYDVVIAKLDSAGNVTWTKKCSFASTEGADDVLQADDGSYILTVNAYINGNNDICILKLDSSGDIIWQKSYGNGDDNSAYSIQQTDDGGYIVAGYNPETFYEVAMVLKLNAGGEINWQKVYSWEEHGLYAVAIEQSMDGGYTAAGTVFAGSYDILALHLDSSGNIIWQKSFGGPSGDCGVYFGKTNDGGSIIASNTDSSGVGGNSDLMLLKLDSNGEIPYCDFIHDVTIEAFNGDMTSQDTNATVEPFPMTVTDTDTIPENIVVNTSLLCYYEDPNDIDGDGVESNHGGEILSRINSSSFLAEGDNCSVMPNGPYLGTCTEGKVGSTCIAHTACGLNGYCSMAQEDTLPPLGNGIGDACDCEGNFNCDADVDGSDAALLKVDFGRSNIEHPCIAGDTCNGDFNCDGDVDGTDASLFKSDFGRSSMQNPCPVCVQEDWCGY